MTEFADPIRASLEGHPPNQGVHFSVNKADFRVLPKWLDLESCPESMYPEVIEGWLIWKDCTMTWTMWYPDFVIEMNVRHLTNDQEWDFHFRNQGYRFHSDQIGFLDERGGEYGNVGVSLVDPYNLKIIVKGYETALYINDQPILYDKLTTAFKSGEASWFDQRHGCCFRLFLHLGFEYIK